MDERNQWGSCSYLLFFSLSFPLCHWPISGPFLIIFDPWFSCLSNSLFSHYLIHFRAPLDSALILNSASRLDRIKIHRQVTFKCERHNSVLVVWQPVFSGAMCLQKTSHRSLALMLLSSKVCHSQSHALSHVCKAITLRLVLEHCQNSLQDHVLFILKQFKATFTFKNHM